MPQAARSCGTWAGRIRLPRGLPAVCREGRRWPKRSRLPSEGSPTGTNPGRHQAVGSHPATHPRLFPRRHEISSMFQFLRRVHVWFNDRLRSPGKLILPLVDDLLRHVGDRDRLLVVRLGSEGRGQLEVLDDSVAHALLDDPLAWAIYLPSSHVTPLTYGAHPGPRSIRIALTCRDPSVGKGAPLRRVQARRRYRSCT